MPDARCFEEPSGSPRSRGGDEEEGMGGGGATRRNGWRYHLWRSAWSALSLAADVDGAGLWAGRLISDRPAQGAEAHRSSAGQRQRLKLQADGTGVMEADVDALQSGRRAVVTWRVPGNTRSWKADRVPAHLFADRPALPCSRPPPAAGVDDH